MREFTVKDLAEILGVSKPTIQRAINAAAIEAYREDKQTRYYNQEAAATISAKVKPDFDFLAVSGCGETPPHDPERGETPPHENAFGQKLSVDPVKQTATTPPQAETPPQNESMELMRTMLTTIQEQLALKDKQIAAYEVQIAFQNKQIQDYSERLREAMELTRGQQYIAAADKTAELLEATGQEEEIKDTAVNEDADPAAPTKKSFWKRFFGKE